VTHEEKAEVITAMRARFERASVTLVATNKGLTVAQATRLRQTLRRVGGEYKVAKHTLTRRALEETRYRELGRLLRGPQGLVFGFADPAAVAKALVDFSDEVDRLQIDGGAVEGQVIAPAGVKNLASMPDLSTLRARVAAQVRTPGSRLASMAMAPAQRIAGAIAALVKKLEGSAPADGPR
jgi:large subunit ribosomal protein L10